MAEEPLDGERPHDEAWWVRELHRNEKLMDKYMAVLGDNPDWDKWKNPDDLYNKVHFDIDPPEHAADTSEMETEIEETEDGKATEEDEGFMEEINEAAENALNDPDW